MPAFSFGFSFIGDNLSIEAIQVVCVLGRNLNRLARGVLEHPGNLLVIAFVCLNADYLAACEVNREIVLMVWYESGKHEETFS